MSSSESSTTSHYTPTSPLEARQPLAHTATAQHGKNATKQALRQPAFHKLPPKVVYTPGPVPFAPAMSTEWIYPIHKDYPIRDYQLEISETAIFANTLVSLPTGLGKTLIAAVVLYNYYRWFPTGKVIFLAPTLPLVDQQMKACYDIMGIPASDTANMTGKVAASERRLLWNERRVFFCTPQTVQRDMEAGRCSAELVVCVVFDEAHKASGAYAYTKIVELLMNTQAKFRILGLSATPGAEIKAIQNVVNALHISKIEARLEDDPNVKKYIHERRQEIVVVKQATEITNIERLLTRLIDPLLERLRSGSGLNVIRGNATITPFCLIKAREEFIRRTGDKSMDAYFFAAQKFVQIRADLRRTGIGMVRQKLARLHDNARGLISSIIRKPEFREIEDAVMRNSADPDNSQETAEDRKLNNPKLMELDKILKEHFKRAVACNQSSRAIVFSQWRESVTEITSVLEAGTPLLRPRHFVGQGKSAGKAKNSGTVSKGMNQKEQQEVVRQFHEGEFNILVCTCIGEEGLDVGEVDLIVNYDCLRSPIRMIQRVGRTGRKRDGRVVCLVSEGQEQRTMIASIAGQKTLGRALKRPNSFKLHPNAPMFPEKPTLTRTNMQVNSQLQLSQVGGHGGSKESAQRSSKVREMPTGDTWRLTPEQERQRQAWLGNINSQPNHSTFPHALRKRLLRARGRSVSLLRRPNGRGGCTSQILLEMSLSNPVGKKKIMPVPTSRNKDGANPLLRSFPLEKRIDAAMDTILPPLWHEPLSDDLVGDQAQLDDEVTMNDQHPLPNQVFQHVDQSVCGRDESISRAPPSAPIDKHRIERNLNDLTTVGDQTPLQNQVFPQGDQSGSGRDESVPPFASRVPPSAPIDKHRIEKNLNGLTTVGDQEPLQNQVFQQGDQSGIGGDESVPRLFSYDPPSAPIDAYRVETISSDVFNLPTPPASSSSESGDDSDDDDTHCDALPIDEGKRPKSIFVKKMSTGNLLPEQSNNMPMGQPEILRLPTQPSSSEGEDSDDETPQDKRSADRTRHRAGSGRSEEGRDSFHEDPVVGGEPVNTDSQQAVDESEAQSKDANDGEIESSNSSEGNLTPMELKRSSAPQDQPARGAQLRVRRGALLSQETASPICRRPTTTPSKAEQLTDTPSVANKSAVESLTDTPVPNETPSETTPRQVSSAGSDEEADEIVCMICHGADSPEDDPIVLCDGPNRDLSCKVAVHASCYGISSSLIKKDSWLCDKCMVVQDEPDGNHNTRCLVCQGERDPLQRLLNQDEETWVHPFCMTWQADEDVAMCEKCSFPGATKCGVSSCQRAAHTHCVIDPPNEPWLTIVNKAKQQKQIYCPEHKHVARQVLPATKKIGAGVRCVILSSTSQSSSAPQKPKTGRPPRFKRLQKKRNRSRAEEEPPHQQQQLERTESKKQRLRLRAQSRQRRMLNCNFIDTEADIESDEDMDGDGADEDDIMRIEEEEELHDNFINDSSQLGYTQDELDLVDEDARETIDVHRQLDIENERKQEFATPVFNRRMMKDRGNEESPSDPWSESRHSDSQRGLGNMHFIRSVLEHHRKGGGCEEIEAMYHQVANEATPEDSPQVQPSPPVRKPIVMTYIPSDDEVHSPPAQKDGRDKHSGTSNVGLTDEQKAMIESKRMEALRRRQQLSQPP